MPRVCSHVDALARGCADRGRNGRDGFCHKREWEALEEEELVNQEEVKNEI